jgi:tetratricopeptide (TPR) repeat protein
MRITMRMAAALMALLAAGFLDAGAQCRLVGSVTDSAGAPVDGVAVVITTPNLTTFKHTVKTDSKGKYSTILNDCTMPYHVVFEKDGFVSSREDKKIPINDLGTIDVKLMKTSEVRAAPGAAPVAAPSGSELAVLAFNAGVEAMNAGDKTAAEAKFLEAVKKNPDLSAGWQALSSLAYEKKDWAKAVEYGEKAVDLDPTLTNLYPMLAEASKSMGDKKGAADWSARYAEANPDSPEILYNKGIQAYNKGKMKEAEETLTRAVDAKPDFANAQFYLGMAAFNLNHKASAKEHLQKYLELEPNGKEAGTVKEILPTLK